MKDRKFLFMVRDELGEFKRAHGTTFLEGEYTFPAFKDDDEPMWNAFITWQASMEEKAQAEWEEIFGSESRVFLEENCRAKFSNMSLGELETYAAYMGW